MKNEHYLMSIKTYVIVIVAFAFLLSGSGIKAASLSNKGLNPAGSPEERHFQIALNNIDASVIAYEREGRIRRLYGDAFSYGRSPSESAEIFIFDNAPILGAGPMDFDEGRLQPIMYLRDLDQYKFTGIYYNQYKGDIPVFRAKLVLLVKNEAGYPLVLASADLRDLGDFEPNLLSNWLNPDNGIAGAMKTHPGLVNFTEPEMVIWAGVEDMVADPVMAYTFEGDNGYHQDGGTPEKYLFVTHAETGEILYKENRIIFTDVVGNVQGKATELPEADFCENEVPMAMPWARVSIGSTYAYADANGDFTISNSGTTQVTVESRLRGRWFLVSNAAGSDEVLTQNVTPPGPADFMQNDANTSEFVRAQVNGYLQSNVVRDFTLVYNPVYPGLSQTNFPVNVNLTGGYCPGNAWYDYSSINFCQSGSGYPNTAWSSVVHHEYGHHLVEMAGSGQGAYGEGMGDVMSVLIADDPGLGYGFYGTCGEPLRNADNTLQYPCSGEIHYCGQLLSGCVWETRNELAITNPVTYLDIISNLTINAMLLHTGSSVDPGITIDFLTLDDDDGDLSNGTPHSVEIITGFGEHNMYGGPPPENDDCADAIAACPGQVYTGSTGVASNDGSASCGSSTDTPDVWYSYTPATGGTATFSLCTGTNYDAVMSIHSGCPGTSSNQLGCDDDGCGGYATPSIITLTVTGGNTYLVRVTGYYGSTGDYTLNITGPDCAGGTPPVLTSGAVTPDTGYYGSLFEFTVDYYDADGDAPVVMQVNIDGIDYDMTLDSGTADNGTYRYRTRDISQDDAHAYYFYGEDGDGDSDQDPPSGTHSGPATAAPDLSLSGTPGPDALMTLEVWGAVNALWASAWSSQAGPYYLPASGLTYDVGPGDVHIVKRIVADPVHLDTFGYGSKDFQLPGSISSGTKYIQGTTKFQAFWAKTNQVTFIIP